MHNKILCVQLRKRHPFVRPYRGSFYTLHSIFFAAHRRPHHPECSKGRLAARAIKGTWGWNAYASGHLYGRHQADPCCRVRASGLLYCVVGPSTFSSVSTWLLQYPNLKLAYVIYERQTDTDRTCSARTILWRAIDSCISFISSCFVIVWKCAVKSRACVIRKVSSLFRTQLRSGRALIVRGLGTRFGGSKGAAAAISIRKLWRFWRRWEFGDGSGPIINDAALRFLSRIAEQVPIIESWLIECKHKSMWELHTVLAYQDQQMQLDRQMM